jgi:hypothetical protein
MYSKKNIKKPINKTMLLSILSNFYKGDNQSSFHIWQWINAAQLLK